MRSENPSGRTLSIFPPWFLRDTVKKWLAVAHGGRATTVADDTDELELEADIRT